MSDIAIRVDGLGKQYRLGAQQAPYQTLGDQIRKWTSLRSLLRRRARTENNPPFWALKDVSFEVKKGEVVGIIGRNGAGKSTLLKILSRITEPTEGTVDLFGRVGSLLEVGTGFHPELTGRENIYLNGAILGMKRVEIARKFDEIVAFAEVEKFIDTPVKHYSSGMYMRLAFAVAAHLEPEILIVDEVLAVGDAEFQKKCLGKMGDVAKEGRTVLFVSHQMTAVKGLCSRVLHVDRGRVVRAGQTAELVEEYLRQSGRCLGAECTWSNGDGPGTNEFRLISMRVLGTDGRLASVCPTSKPIILEMEFNLAIVHSALCVGLALFDKNGVVVFQSCHNDGRPEDWPLLRIGTNVLRCTVPAGWLSYGTYAVAPKAYLHSINWIYNGEPVVRFESYIDHSQSPMWGLLNPAHFPGVVAPCLHWSTSDSCV